MSKNTRRQLEQSLLFIGNNLDKNLLIEEIANKAHMSEHHFQRVFSTYLGETVNQYVLHRRLESAAKMLISQQNKKIIDVANDSGFGDHSYFSRVFKKHFELSPHQFRQGCDGNVFGADANRPFLRTASSKYKPAEVNIKILPSLWFNNKQTAMNRRDENYHEEKLLKIQEAFNEIFDSHASEIYGIASHCGCDNYTDPQACAKQITTMSHGAVYRRKQDDAWSSDWLKIESGTWAVVNHYGDYNYKYQTFNNVIRSWLRARVMR